LIDPKNTHSARQHWSNSRTFEHGYASRFVIKSTAATILPKSFALDNRDELEKYFPTMLVTAMIKQFHTEVTLAVYDGVDTMNGITELTEVDENATTKDDFGNEAANVGGTEMDIVEDDDVVYSEGNDEDDETTNIDAVTKNIWQSYATDIVLKYKATAPPRSYSGPVYKKWKRQQTCRSVKKKKAISKFWMNVANVHSEQIRFSVEEQVTKEQELYKQDILGMAMNVDITTNQVGKDYDADTINSERNIFLGQNKDTSVEQTRSVKERQFDQTVPFLIAGNAQLTVDWQKRMAKLNQTLISRFPKGKKNAAHNGVSLYLTASPGGKACQGKSFSVHLNKSIISQHDNPSSLEHNLQQEIIAVCSHLVKESFGKMDFYKSIMSSIHNDESLQHMIPYLIEGTPCSHIWLSAVHHGNHVHIDKNTIGPTFYFLLEQPLGLGGELKLIQ
jgi:hypothetical protein